MWCLGRRAITDQFRAGGLRLVGIVDDKERSFFPGVKTFPAQGYKVLGSNTYGFSAPAGTPKPVVDALVAGIKKVAEDAEYVDKAQKMARTPRFLDSAGYAKYWDELDTELKPIVDAFSRK